MGRMAKWRGDHGGAHLGQQTSQQTVVAARRSRAAPLDSGDGGGSMWGVLRLREDDGKLHEDVLALLPASIAASGGGRWCTTAAAGAKSAAQFGSKICTI
jgi:hypothetical protein